MALLANALGDNILRTKTASAPPAAGEPILSSAALTRLQLERRNADAITRNSINYAPVRGLQTESRVSSVTRRETKACTDPSSKDTRCNIKPAQGIYVSNEMGQRYDMLVKALEERFAPPYQTTLYRAQ